MAATGTKTITKKEIAQQVSTSTGLTITQVGDVIQQTMDRLIAELASGSRIEFRDFGVFSTKLRAARTARNPKTGAPVAVPERTVVVFKAGKVMKEKVEAPK